MPITWRHIRRRSIESIRLGRDQRPDAATSQFSGNFLLKLQEFFDLKQNEAGDKSVGIPLDWPNFLYMVSILLLTLVVVAGTIVLGLLFIRRLWRYTTRMRRKAALRNFDTKPSGVPRRFSRGLMVESHGPKIRHFHSTSRIFELPNYDGKIPQIRISVSSDRLTPDRPHSAMSNSSALPPSFVSWTESRSSIATTISHAPGSPSAASFASAYPETSLGQRSELSPSPASNHSSLSVHTLSSFWQRIAKRHIRFTQQQQVERQRLLGQVQQQFLLDVDYQGVESVQSPICRSTVSSPMGHLSENGSSHHDEDRDIDERSIAHYELSFHNGDKTSTSCFRGTLTYQLRYDFIHRVLMLHIIRASRLPTADGPPNPYIKVYCLPERRNHCKTSILKKSADPEFNEMFSFDVPYNQLPKRMLQFTVYDFDRFTRHGLIGNVIMRTISSGRNGNGGIETLDRSDLYNWTEFTMQIVGSQEKNDFGDLLLYLAYSVPLRKLYVTVSKAYNLRPMDITGASDPYVKVELIYQRKRVKMRKTSIKRANLNPVYHECLEFDLLPSQVPETNLLVQIMDWDRIGRNDLLGCCIIGRESPTKDGRQQWDQCFAGLRLSDSTPQMSHSVSVGANTRMDSSCNGIHKDGGQYSDSKFYLGVGGPLPQMSVSQYGEGVDESGQLEDPMENGRLRAQIAQSAPTSAKTSTVSSMNGQTASDGVPRAVGVWHSILADIPEGFCNIPKAKKK